MESMRAKRKSKATIILAELPTTLAISNCLNSLWIFCLQKCLWREHLMGICIYSQRGCLFLSLSLYFILQVWKVQEFFMEEIVGLWIIWVCVNFVGIRVPIFVFITDDLNYIITNFHFNVGLKHLWKNHRDNIAYF